MFMYGHQTTPTYIPILQYTKTPHSSQPPLTKRKKNKRKKKKEKNKSVWWMCGV
jgi:hypothetical protein